MPIMRRQRKSLPTKLTIQVLGMLDVSWSRRDYPNREKNDMTDKTQELLPDEIWVYEQTVTQGGGHTLSSLNASCEPFENPNIELTKYTRTNQATVTIPRDVSRDKELKEALNILLFQDLYNSAVVTVAYKRLFNHVYKLDAPELLEEY